MRGYAMGGVTLDNDTGTWVLILTSYVIVAFGQVTSSHCICFLVYKMGKSGWCPLRVLPSLMAWNSYWNVSSVSHWNPICLFQLPSAGPGTEPGWHPVGSNNTCSFNEWVNCLIVKHANFSYKKSLLSLQWKDTGFRNHPGSLWPVELTLKSQGSGK